MRSVLFVLATALTVSAQQANASPAVGPQSASAARVPLVVLTGNDSHVKQMTYVRIASAADWKKAWLNHLGLKEDTIYRPALEVDFDRCVVVAVFKGATWNTAGLEIESVRDVKNAVVVRFDSITYQTGGPDGGGERVTPYAFIVLPKTDNEIVLQENHQNEIGEPPKWKEVARLGIVKK